MTHSGILGGKNNTLGKPGSCGLNPIFIVGSDICVNKSGTTSTTGCMTFVNNLCAWGTSGLNGTIRACKITQTGAVAIEFKKMASGDSDPIEVESDLQITSGKSIKGASPITVADTMNITASRDSGAFTHPAIIASGSEAIQATGSVGIQGILSIPGFTNVSASLATAGSGNTPPVSPPQGNPAGRSSYANGGGGGGAGAAGSDGTINGSWNASPVPSSTNIGGAGGVGAFIDATFYDNKEINNRNISEIPHPFVIETMDSTTVVSTPKSDKPNPCECCGITIGTISLLGIAGFAIYNFIMTIIAVISFTNNDVEDVCPNSELWWWALFIGIIWPFMLTNGAKNAAENKEESTPFLQVFVWVCMLTAFIIWAWDQLWGVPGFANDTCVYENFGTENVTCENNNKGGHNLFLAVTNWIIIYIYLLVKCAFYAVHIYREKKKNETETSADTTVVPVATIV